MFVSLGDGEETMKHTRAIAAAVILAVLPAIARSAGSAWRASGELVLDGGPVETLDGVLAGPEGSLVVWGNSWGAPAGPLFDKQAVLGRQKASGSGAPAEVDPLAMEAADDPARTGFVLELGPDLTARGGVRFAGGIGTVDAAVMMADGGLVISGMAREGFGALAPAGRLKRIPPRKNDARFGPVVHRGKLMPGDVYIARLRADRKGFEWGVLLERHRKSPERLYVGADKRVYFHSRALYAVGSNGAVENLGFSDPATAELLRSFGGRHPGGDSLLTYGWRVTRDGNRDWVGPLVEVWTLDGKLRRRFYDWTGALAGSPLIGLGAPAPLTHAAWTLDDGIVVAAATRRKDVVLTADPVDPTHLLKSAGDACKVLPPAWIPVEQLPMTINIARFDSGSGGNGICTRLAAPSYSERRILAGIMLRGLDIGAENRIALHGDTDLVAETEDKRWHVSGRTSFTAVLASDLSLQLPVHVLEGVQSRDATLSGAGVVVCGFRRPVTADKKEGRAGKQAAGYLLKLSP